MELVLLLISFCAINFGSVIGADTSRHCGNHETGRAVHFSYDDTSAWAEDFPTCGGKSQSPINIPTWKAKHIRYATPLNLMAYDTVLPSNSMTNNGHTVSVSVPKDIIVTGGPAGKDQFKLAQFHFHFGKSSDDGSEHLIDNEAFAMEIHFVHYNTKYPSMDEATNNSDGLLVVGVLASSSGSFLHGLKELSVISDHLNEVKGSDTNTTVESDINLMKLFPDKQGVEKYYTYAGSLTTPKCLEVVTWVVAANPIKISEKQLRSFRKLRDSCNRRIAGNYRPVLPLNGRDIFVV